MRASNLQDLIYKRGQAGVTKASVTIVFNNEDRARSPVGFESYRQITVTRQVNTYILKKNGLITHNILLGAYGRKDKVYCQWS